MTRKTTVIIGLGLITLAAGACHRFHNRCHHNPEKIKKFITWKVDDVLDDIDANEAQRQSIQQIKDELLTEIFSLHAEHKADHHTFFKELTSEQPDADLLHKKVDQGMDRLRALAHKAVDALIEVHATLTPEQREELRENLHGCSSPH